MPAPQFRKRTAAPDQLARRHRVDAGPIVLATPAPISHRTAEESLGLGYLASILRAHGYVVTIIDGWLEGLESEDIVRAIVRLPVPLWLGFSCYRSNMPRVVEVVESLKRLGCRLPVVVGGFGPTFHVDEFLSNGIDIVVRGDAEEAVLELTAHFAEGKPPLAAIRGISFRVDGITTHTPPRPLVTDLDALPQPSRDTLPLALQRRTPAHLSTSRGCTGHCPFCSVVAFARVSTGPAWRGRSVTSIVDEIEAMVQLGATHFKVVDDSFLEPPRDVRWCRALADAIAQRGLRVWMRGMVRADRIDDDIVGELARAGFFSFFCGIENYASSALARMVKPASVEQNYRALAAFHKFGMYVNEGHILFDDRTTLDELRQNLRGMRDHAWVMSRGVFSEMYAAEGTPFARVLDKRGRLIRDTSGLGNHRYLVKDPGARCVYDALKRWHKARMAVYDKTIDPVAAPKALDAPDLARFHALYQQLRLQDLDVFEQVLDRAEHGEPADDVLAFVDRRLEDTGPWLRSFDQQVDVAYDQTGLLYDADLNPFVC